VPRRCLQRDHGVRAEQPVLGIEGGFGSPGALRTITPTGLPTLTTNLLEQLRSAAVS
jgi:hypothetical protein